MNSLKSIKAEILPLDWREIERLNENTQAFRSKNGLLVVVSFYIYEGESWQHVSVSRKGRLPDWKDMRVVKNIFVGREKLAIQVLPPEKEYVNIHPYCLHLWHCLDRRPIPDFQLIKGVI